MKNANTSFRLLIKKRNSEYGITLFEYQHIKSGARIVWVKNDDKDKYFAIDFRTLPKDNTGVAHIMEHSLLMGSEKYDFGKYDPFAYLLRTRMMTFLNASTYPDKTGYMFSSVNNEDFFYVMDIYLNSVFKPLAIHNPNILRQEGWRVEKEDGKYKYTGVVLNEMKSYAGDPTGEVYGKLFRHALHGTPYQYESGGNPNYIPSLTFNKFKQFYKEFYNPALCKVFLYGDVDIKRALNLLDSYFSNYKRQKPVKNPVKISQNQSVKHIKIHGTTNDSIWARAFVGPPKNNLKEVLKAQILSELLAGFSSDPIRRVLQESELFKDGFLTYETDLDRTMFILFANKTSAKEFKYIEELFDKTFLEVYKTGLDKKRIQSVFDRLLLDFESIKLSKSAGEAFYNQMARFWWLVDTGTILNAPKILRDIKKELNKDTRYFEKALKKYFVANKNVFTVRAYATDNFNQFALLEKRQDKLNTQKDTSDIDKQIEEFNLYKQQRAQKGVSEITSTDIKSISKSVTIPVASKRVSGGNLILTSNFPVKSSLLSFSAYFDARHLSVEELQMAEFILNMLHILDGFEVSRENLDSDIASYLKSFKLSLLIQRDKNGKPLPTIYLSSAYLVKNEEKVIRVFNEYLNNMQITKEKTEQFLGIYLANRSDAVKDMRQAYNLVALRSGAPLSDVLAMEELLSGISFLKHIDTWVNLPSAEFTDMLQKVYAKMFANGKVSFAISKPTSVKTHIYDALNFPKKRYARTAFSNPFKKENIAFYIKGLGVHHTAESFVGEKFSAHNMALSEILTYGYLWHKVRELGGAYGVRLDYGYKSGINTFMSLNDPNLSATFRVYKNSLEDLTDFTKEELHGAIAKSSLKYFDRPKQILGYAQTVYDYLISGISKSKLQSLKAQLLSLKEADIENYVKKLKQRYDKESVKVAFLPENYNKAQAKKEFDRIEVLDF